MKYKMHYSCYIAILQKEDLETKQTNKNIITRFEELVETAKTCDVHFRGIGPEPSLGRVSLSETQHTCHATYYHIYNRPSVIYELLYSLKSFIMYTNYGNLEKWSFPVTSIYSANMYFLFVFFSAVKALWGMNQPVPKTNAVGSKNVLETYFIIPNRNCFLSQDEIIKGNVDCSCFMIFSCSSSQRWCTWEIYLGWVDVCLHILSLFIVLQS